MSETPIKFAGEDPSLLTLTGPSKASVWTIELHNGQDSRLTFQLLTTLKAALTAVEDAWNDKDEDRSGAVIIVGNRKQDKFFSNGLDFENSSKDPHFFLNHYNPLMVQLLSFPIPVVAAINGHCFAAGMILALCCDYRVMVDGASRRAWMCMNEIHFGAPMPASFCALFREKVTDNRLQRTIFLEGKRLTPQEALSAGLVDAIVPGGTADILKQADKLASQIAPLSKTSVYGLMKAEMYVEVLKKIAEEGEPETSQKSKL